MKVLLYTQGQSTLSKSGIGRALLHQMKALESAGVEVTLDPEDTFDLAHVNTIWAGTRSLVRKLKKRGIPVIVHGHSTYEDFRESFRLWKLIEPWFDRNLKKAYSLADLIVTPTPYSKKLIDSYGFGVDVVAVSNGIDMADYAPSSERQAAFRAAFGLKEGDKYVIGVGFPFVRKGILEFFETARSFPDIKFFWFGSLQKIATQLKVLRAIRKRPENVLMPGYVKGDLIKGAYEGALAMLFPSHEETEGIVVLEALASRCPLIVSEAGAFSPWLVDGVNCLKGKDVEGYRAAILKILAGKYGEKMLDAGYETAAERDLPRTGEELKAVYSSLLEKKGKAR